MCGIAGFLDNSIQHPEQLLKRMTDAIVHRGPDDDGRWWDCDSGIALGHRRLAILDLSLAGHQPMQSASGRYILVFNGEIYNHLDLRNKLSEDSCAPSWRGHSDTEILLAGFDTWGIQKTVECAIGMFAFAVWDQSTQTLTLVRDRVGEKPLYYGWQGKSFLFASELKALHPHPAFRGTINRNALSLLLRHNYIPSPYSIYEGISKLQPGCLLAISLKQREPKMCAYWSAAQVAEDGVMTLYAGSPKEAVDDLEELLKDAVRQQMMADVPLGAFLSGGVDSSTIVALMQAQSSRPVKTFSIGFYQDAYNEAGHAKAVAGHLGTDHTELYVTPEQAMAVIPRLPILYDEPFSDSSQIPTFLVSQLARQHVTVSLSGDAGDELFCGYNRYQLTSRLWRVLSSVPVFLRALAARGIISMTPQSWDRMAAAVGWLLPESARMASAGDKLHKGADVMTSDSVKSLYHNLVSHWRNPASVVIDGLEPPTLMTGNSPKLSGLNAIERMMALDIMSYLPDDILVKIDRAAMGVSLESRVPFLDHRVVEFAWHLPLDYKLRDGQTKWILRQVLYRHVPKDLIERSKMGFGIPLDDWLRGPLRDWCEALLDESRLKREGYFNPLPIRQKWAEHISGQRNWAYPLWDVLMFQAWLKNEKDYPK